MLVAAHPNDPTRRVAVRAKGNYNAEPPAFEFAIEEHVIDNGARGRRKHLITTSRIWDWYESGVRADEVLASQNNRKRDDSKVGQARSLIRELLADGEEHPAKDITGELLHEYDISVRTSTAAANDVGVRKRQEGFQGRWLWSLPPGGGAK